MSEILKMEKRFKICRAMNRKEAEINNVMSDRGRGGEGVVIRAPTGTPGACSFCFSANRSKEYSFFVAREGFIQQGSLQSWFYKTSNLIVRIGQKKILRKKKKKEKRRSSGNKSNLDLGLTAIE
jgi:hypothetical protein